MSGGRVMAIYRAGSRRAAAIAALRDNGPMLGPALCAAIDVETGKLRAVVRVPIADGAIVRERVAGSLYRLYRLSPASAAEQRPRHRVQRGRFASVWNYAAGRPV